MCSGATKRVYKCLCIPMLVVLSIRHMYVYIYYAYMFHVHSEEWMWLNSLSSPSSCPFPSSRQPHMLTSGAQSLQYTLLPTIDTFLHNLGISKEEVEGHQLYCHEAIELNEKITILLLMPPHEQVCTPPGSTDHFDDLPGFVALPINTFEISEL